MSLRSRELIQCVAFAVVCLGACSNRGQYVGNGGGSPGAGAAGLGTGGNTATAGHESGGSAEPVAGASSGAGTTATSFDAGTCQHPAVEAKCTDGWCEIPAGCFVMGSPESEWGHALVEEQQVAVTLTRSFLIQQTEVTQAQWLALGLPNPVEDTTEAGSCTDDPSCPVGNVTWFEAAAYANLLSERATPPLSPCYRLLTCEGTLGRGLRCGVELAAATVYECEGFRLPTDAEWEYAARAGTTTAYYSGENMAYGDYVQNFTYCNPDSNLERIGWYCYNSGGAAHRVGQLEPNAWGLYDLCGNLNEWTSDRSDGLPAQAPVDPGASFEAAAWANIRGGAFRSWASLARLASQNERHVADRHTDVGFRLVRTLKR